MTRLPICSLRAVEEATKGANFNGMYGELSTEPWLIVVV